MFARYFAIFTVTTVFISLSVGTSNPSAAAFTGTICNTDIASKFHARLRAATKGHHGNPVSLNCHNFTTGPARIYLTARKDGYFVQASLKHLRIGADDLYTSFMRLTLKGQVYNQKEDVISLGPHLPAGKWKAAARKLTRHIGEIYAKDVQRKIRECQKQPRSIRGRSSTTRTTRDHRGPEKVCLLDVPVLKEVRDHRKK